ncbi:hypothetical protein L914_04045 [Phytophthora nicotianae]|uniref:Uncharacterized protein n=1 Tax=Phytophthora nicotianae TaxID=4792 RepID=W2NV21_PHYNI|nr:hypothetical protein L914_04045 [Phytophthora nicotianae]
MAEEFRAGPLHDDSYEALEVTEPMQTDSDSCGVEAPSDVSPTGNTNLRWKMLHAVMKLRPR